MIPPREAAAIVEANKQLASVAAASMLSARCRLWAQGATPDEIERVLADHKIALTRWRSQALAVVVGEVLDMKVDPDTLRAAMCQPALAPDRGSNER